MNPFPSTCVDSSRPGLLGFSGSGATAHFSTGHAAGIAGFRSVGCHDVPRSHPLGSTEQGHDWFLGFVAGLMEATEAESLSLIEKAPDRRQPGEGHSTDSKN